MKILSILILAASLVGCSDSARERKFPAMPEELSGCRVFYVQNQAGDAVTVARCPNSVTTASVRSGKTTKTTITIDGVEYAQIVKRRSTFELSSRERRYRFGRREKT